MFSKKDAVNLDERFIEWIANSEGDFEKCQDKRYIAICPYVGDSYVGVYGYDTLEEIIKALKELGDEERAGAPLEAIFDMKEKKELKFKEEYKLTITP